MRWYFRGLNRLPWATAVIAGFTLFSWWSNLWTPQTAGGPMGGIDLWFFLR
jgi:hypothetical protein